MNNSNTYLNELKLLENNENYENLFNKSVLITGANGLIGSAIVDFLNYLNNYLNGSIKIFILVRSKILDRFKEYKNLNVIYQDINDELKIIEKIDYIIHAASNSHPQKFATNPVETMYGNFIGMKNVLEFATKNNVKRVEFISSGEIYGQGEENIFEFNEEYNGKINPCNSRSCYPISKLAAETLCVSYSSEYNIETVIARPCHIYGPTQTLQDSRVSAQFIRNVLNNEDIVMKSEGTQIRSYCYVLDCVSAILKILLDGDNCNAYNISNKNSIISIRKMAEIIAQNANKKIIFEIPPQAEKNSYNPVTRSVLNPQKLYDLGWKPIWNFEQGIKATIKIMKEVKFKTKFLLSFRWNLLLNLTR